MDNKQQQESNCALTGGGSGAINNNSQQQFPHPDQQSHSHTHYGVPIHPHQHQQHSDAANAQYIQQTQVGGCHGKYGINECGCSVEYKCSCQGLGSGMYVCVCI